MDLQSESGMSFMGRTCALIGLVQLNFDFAGHGALSHPNILECTHITKWKQISNLTAFIQGQNESD